MIVPPTAVPFGLSAWMGLTQQVELNWTEEGIVDRFELERAPDLSGTPGSWSQIAVFNSTNPDLPFSDTNVVANTTYWYRLRAHSAVGYSDYTDPIQISTVPPVDGAVDFSVALDNPVKLFWSYFGGNDIVGFSVERAPDDGGAPGAWQPIDSFVNTNHASDFSFVDTNVLANTVYWYRVRTFNWAGYSDSTIARSIGLFPPDVPYAFTVLPPNRHTVELFWSEALGFPGTFEVERAPDVNGSPGPWGLLVTTNELVYYDTNLTAFATYWYRVRAGNWVGYSGYTTPLSVTIGPPAAPFAPTATIGAATNSVDVAWTDYGADEDAFNIERAPDNNGAPGAWTELAVLPVTNLYNSISFTDTNVTAYTTNWYRVRAFNDIGNSAYSDPVSIALLPPATPKNFIGFLSLPATLTLYWNDYDPLAQGFKIERALDNNGVPGTWLEITNISGGYFESYLDESVAPNTTYWYRIRAYNWVADSAYADAIIPIPPVPTFSPQPQILTLTQTNGGMLIQWSTTAGNTDIVQASGNFTSGYTNLSPALFIGSGTTNTNYFDAGALSNSPVRYYRIQSTH